MRGHDRYEALAGALLLDEATAGERAEFAAHAEGCARCRADAVSLGVPLREFVEAASEHETWRPSLAGDVRARIAESRQKRVRFAVGTLGYAVAASLVINIAFVTGFAGRAIDALRVVPDFRYATTQPIAFEHRPRAAVEPAPAMVPIERVARRAAHVRVERPRQKMKSGGNAGSRPASDAIEGLALWKDAESAARDVAQIERRCESAVDAVFTPEEPCPSPESR
jgi:putative zinc finger protein